MIHTPNRLNRRLEDLLGVPEANQMLSIIEQNSSTEGHFYQVLSYALVGQLEKYKPISTKYTPKEIQQEFKFPETVDPKQLYMRL